MLDQVDGELGYGNWPSFPAPTSLRLDDSFGVTRVPQLADGRLFAFVLAERLPAIEIPLQQIRDGHVRASRDPHPPTAEERLQSLLDGNAIERLRHPCAHLRASDDVHGPRAPDHVVEFLHDVAKLRMLVVELLRPCRASSCTTTSGTMRRMLPSRESARRLPNSAPDSVFSENNVFLRTRRLGEDDMSVRCLSHRTRQERHPTDRKHKRFSACSSMFDQPRRRRRSSVMLRALIPNVAFGEPLPSRR